MRGVMGVRCLDFMFERDAIASLSILIDLFQPPDEQEIPAKDEAHVSA